MSVEEQLRTGLAGLVADPPPTGDRVAGVERRVRRRARRRTTGAVVLTAVACLGVAGLTALPAPAERPPVAAEAPLLTARDLLVPMTRVRIDLGLPAAERDAVVDRALQALVPPPDHVSREVGAVREVLFTDGLDRRRLEAFLDGVLVPTSRSGAAPGVSWGEVQGSAFALTVPLSAEVRAALPAGALGPELLPELRDTLRVHSVTRPGGSDDLTIEYEAWALDQRTLDRVVGLLARSVGADPEDVRIRALPAD